MSEETLTPIDAQPTEVCSICTEYLTTEVVATTCHHNYHNECITEWLKAAVTCPLCRQTLTEGRRATNYDLFLDELMGRGPVYPSIMGPRPMATDEAVAPRRTYQAARMIRQTSPFVFPSERFRNYEINATAELHNSDHQRLSALDLSRHNARARNADFDGDESSPSMSRYPLRNHFHLWADAIDTFVRDHPQFTREEGDRFLEELPRRFPPVSIQEQTDAITAYFRDRTSSTVPLPSAAPATNMADTLTRMAQRFTPETITPFDGPGRTFLDVPGRVTYHTSLSPRPAERITLDRSPLRLEPVFTMDFESLYPSTRMSPEGEADLRERNPAAWLRYQRHWDRAVPQGSLAEQRQQLLAERREILRDINTIIREALIANRMRRRDEDTVMDQFQRVSTELTAQSPAVRRGDTDSVWVPREELERIYLEAAITTLEQPAVPPREPQPVPLMERLADFDGDEEPLVKPQGKARYQKRAARRYQPHPKKNQRPVSQSRGR